MFQIQDNEGKIYVGHVRGKMRGKSKRNNLVKVHDIVLMGMREWESERKNVDILYIYEENQISLITQRSRDTTSNLIEQNDLITYDYGGDVEVNKDSAVNNDVPTISYDGMEGMDIDLAAI